MNLDVVELETGRFTTTEEALGTKEKAWVHGVPGLPEGRRYLWKASKVWSGNHWSEYLASHLMLALGVPAHETLLARWDGVWGVLCGDVRENDDEELVHGADILVDHRPGGAAYQRELNYPPQYQVGIVLDCLDERVGPEAAQGLARQLVIDCWLRNSDRHHENWAILRRAGDSSRVSLAAAFDNASCLARDEAPAKMQQQLQSGHLNNFLKKSASAFVSEVGGGRIRLKQRQLMDRLRASRWSSEVGMLVDEILAWLPESESVLGDLFHVVDPAHVEVRTRYLSSYLRLSAEELGFC